MQSSSNISITEEKVDPTNNQYRIRSLAHAIYSVQNAPHPITSGKEAIKLPRVGKGTADRIEMFLQGKKYGSEHEAAQRERFKLAKALQTIPGLGSRTADNLIADGVTALSELRHPEHFRRLTPAQRIGLVYAKPLAESVSRQDAEIVADFIRDHISSNFKVELMGAYRRELANASSLSILLSHPSVVHVPVPSRAKSPAVGSGRVSPPFTDIASRYSISPLSSGTKHESTFALAQDAVRPLEDVGLVAATLVSQSRRWSGIAALPTREPDEQWGNMGERLRDIRRRRGRFVSLNLSLAPLKSLGAARLFLTGDDDFIRAARTAAMRQGLLLNEYGLWRWVPGPHAPVGQIFPDRSAVGRGKTQWAVATRDEGLEGDWELLEAETEEEILEQLGMGLVPPAKRNFMFLRPRSDMRAKDEWSDVVVPPDEVLEAMHLDLLESGGVFTPKVRKVGRPRTRTREVGGIQESRPRGRPKRGPELPESPVPPELDEFDAVD
ncbi:Nucleotidyltransferase [Peniophora sp. CONT]|nr:Nucleotidyltransferase [Peniophora sp. CONT]